MDEQAFRKFDTNLMESKLCGDKQITYKPTDELKQAQRGLLGNIFNRESVSL